MTFAEPLGLLALLGVPAVILIHLLRQHPPQALATTLFLLQAVAPEDMRGRRVEWPRRSLLLLLQLLVVLVLAWVLAQPRWAQGARRLPVIVVVDESASMSAFQEPAQAELTALLESLAHGVTLDVTLLSSHPSREALGRGEGPRAAAGLSAARPDLGAHDAGPALEVARQRAGQDGVVVYLTDHPDPRPGALVLSVGRPTENVGFTGLAFEGEGWAATLQNHGAQDALRRWRLEAGGAQVDAGEVTVAPGEVRVLRGAFPPGAERARLALSADAFTLDDTLDMVRPRPKTLRVAVSRDAAGLSWLTRLLARAPHVVVVGEGEAADLMMDAGKDGVRAEALGQPWLRFALDPQLDARQPSVGVTVEQDALTEDLPWSGLVFRRPPRLAKLPPGARTLVWKGDLPLVVAGPGQDLLVRIDPRGSNAARSVAVLLMLVRYLDQVRARVPREEAYNAELGEPLTVAAAEGAGDVEVRGEGGVARYPQDRLQMPAAPARPGAFEVWQGEARLMVGATRFADVREAALSGAAPARPAPQAVAAVREVGQADDPLRGAWMLAALGLMLGTFWLSRGEA